MADRPDGLQGIDRALVVGLGVSGRAAARLLMANAVQVTVVDDDPERRSGVPGASLHPGSAGELDPANWDVVVPSPGVPEHAPVVQQALAAGVPVWSEPEVAWRVRPSPLVGVTGTNGKTSVTQLIAAMLDRAGIPAVVCGNIGVAMADVIADHAAVPALPLLVVELSSFQLRFIDRLSPAIAVILNLAPDHLDWHGSWEAYRDAKARLVLANEQGTLVAGDDDGARALVSLGSGTRLETSSRGAVARGVGVEDGVLVAQPGSDRLVAVADLPTAASHIVANAAAAAAAAIAAGADQEAVGAALRSWKLGSHRLEVVGVTAGDVTWVNDSKATNVHATIAALASAPSIVWIAGGQAKGTDLSVLGEHLSAVRHAVLLGESADALAEVCGTSNVPVSRAGTMQQAVSIAAAEARPGDRVLLSPAGASFDLFDGYADRGDQFAAAVRQLADVQQESS